MGSIPAKPVRGLKKVAHRVAFFDLKGGDGHWVKSKTKDVCERVFEDW